MPHYTTNRALLIKRFPSFEKIIPEEAPSVINVFNAKDGGICYAVQNESGQWTPGTNPENPIAVAQNSIQQMSGRLGSGMSPAVIVGLNPGYELTIVYNLFLSRTTQGEPFRRIYVVVDSIVTLIGWLMTEDRSEILNREEVEFYTTDTVTDIIDHCENDPSRSHHFIPLSSLPSERFEQIIAPLAELLNRRHQEQQQLHAENCAYYSSLTDDQLADIINGKTDRAPRLLIPAHGSSTVVQYQARDAAAALSNAGWETKTVIIEREMTPWRISKLINEFKPDVFISINHTRRPQMGCYPEDMLYVTWVQDTCPNLNNSETAEKWNKMAEGRRRDLIIGYTDQLKEYGYLEDRLQATPMLVNTEIFHPRDLSEEQKQTYQCDVCFASNRSKTTERCVTEDLLPEIQQFGFTADILMQLHDHLWNEYRAGNSFTDYQLLRKTLISIDPFTEILLQHIPEKQNFIIQRIFWDLNDPIYRFTVLEWLDDYAKQTPDFNLHIYGKGWENHPRFSKYAKGPLPHGPELSIAYQAARFCLHLNSLEGGHQRLLEITASGACPITRSSNQSLITPKNLSGALRKIVGVTHFNHDIKLNEDELSALNTNAFSAATLHLNSKKEPETFATAYANSIQRRLTSEIEWAFENWDKLTFNSKRDFLSVLSAENDTGKSYSYFKTIISSTSTENILKALRTFLNDTSTITSEWLKKIYNPEPVLDVAEQLLKTQASIPDLKAAYNKLPNPDQSLLLKILHKIAMTDKTAVDEKLFSEIKTDQLTIPELPEYVRTFVLLNGLQKTETLIQSHYNHYPEAKNLYSIAGWLHAWEKRDFQTVIKWIEKDLTPGTITAGWIINIATAYAKSGKTDVIEDLCRKAYTLESAVTDGHVRPAWAYFMPRQQTKELLPYFEKDWKKGKLSPFWQENYIQILSINEQPEEALRLTEDCYQKSKSAKGCYSKIAWFHYHRLGNYHKAAELLLLEQKVKRESLETITFQAIESAFLDNFDEAEEIITQAYTKHPELTDCYARLGWELYWPQWKFKKILPWFEKDKKVRRLSAAWISNYAQALAANGKEEEALSIADGILKENPNSINLYAKVGVGCAFNRRPEKALVLFEKDSFQNRLSENLQFWHVLAALLACDYDKAKSISADKPEAFFYGLYNFIYFHTAGITVHSPDWKAIDNILSPFLAGSASPHAHLCSLWTLAFTNNADKLNERMLTVENRNFSFLPKVQVLSAFLNLLFFNNFQKTQPILDKIDLRFFYGTEIELNVYLFLLTACEAACGRIKNSLGHLEVLKQNLPYFFCMKNQPARSCIPFFGIIAKAAGNNALASKCCDFAKSNSRNWIFYEDFITSTINRTTASESIKIANIPLPFR